MTGFGKAIGETSRWVVVAELRSFNGRGFKFHANLPRGLTCLEPRLRALVRERVDRGSIELQVTADDKEAYKTVRILPEAVREYCNAIGKALAESGLDLAVQVGDITELPGVLIEEKSEVGEDLSQLVVQVLSEALSNMVAMRRAEGAVLDREIRGYLSRLSAISRRLAEIHAAATHEYQERLRSRFTAALAASGVPAQSGDINRELIYYMERTDISEELTRLDSHIAQFISFLDRGGAIGRELEFVAREMLRECNTISDKSVSSDVDETMVEFGGIVERIREQVANIE